MTWLTDVTVAMSLGLLGNLHCVQMCGPIVLAYSMDDRSRRSALRMHLAYNGGRILTYTLIGSLAGLAGGALTFAGRLAGLQQVGTVIAGGCMVLVGLALTGRGPGVPQWLVASPVGRLMRLAAPRLSRSTLASRFTLGLVLGLLPCGLIYAALARAAATGTPVRGALTMAIFGTATSVGLLAVGIGASPITRRLGRSTPRLAAVWVILLGAVIMWRGVVAQPPGATHHADLDRVETAHPLH